MKWKRILAAALASASALLTVTACSNASGGSGMRDITTQELVHDMGIGINLGNTFESCGTWINNSSVTNYETGWGSPVVTQEMIQGYADCGFGVLRVPVAWSNMMQENYTIHPDYLARVHEVVDWALDAGLYVILDDIRDPGNLGTIVRTAEAAGARVILSKGCVDIFNPKVVRSTMGTIFRVPFAICDTVTAIERLHEEGVTVCAAMLDGSIPYTELDVSGACAFIIGNEANGVSSEAAEASDGRVRIPMRGRVESLNAAVSAAILMYSKVAV